MLVDLKTVLAIAASQNIAAGSFNITSLENLMAVIGAAEELNVPVVVQFAEMHESIMPIDVIGPVMLQMARQSTVPVCVHLDHGETLPFIQKALNMGFTSIMFDGSTLPYDENVANTLTAVYMAHRVGASVEAEIGSMSGREMGDGKTDTEVKAVYTDPAEAASFVEDTGIDALACSFGTAHGLYLTKPVLNLDILSQIHEAVKVPLVMHGSSGIEPQDFRNAIDRGILKVNYYTYMVKAGGEAVVNYSRKHDGVVFYHEIEVIGREAMKQNVFTTLKIITGRDQLDMKA